MTANAGNKLMVTQLLPEMDPTTLPPSTDDLGTSPRPHSTMSFSTSQAFVQDGNLVSSYRIELELGRGGMGTVYKAFDQKLNRYVALKMLHVGASAVREERARFLGEAELMAKLQHTNVVQVYDHGEHEGKMYLVMEYIEGGSLDKDLRGRPQYPRKSAEMVKTLADAVHVAHLSKIVHRDLKPANIMRTSSGVLKITDFGLAKRLQSQSGLTPTGGLMGTPSYMAPEQAAGKSDVGPAADIYALGAMLYEMLTGRPPFLGASLPETLDQVQNAEPAPPSRLVPRLPRDIQTICLKCLQKSPGRRYTTAQDLADDLNNFLEGLPVKARPTHGVERMVRAIARKPKEAALVATAVGLVVLAVVFGLVMWKVHEDRERDELQAAHEKEVGAAKDKALAEKQKQEEAEKLHAVFEEMMDLMKTADLSTRSGLDQFELKLGGKVNSNRGSPNEKKTAIVLADGYLTAAEKRWQQGEQDRAVQNLEQAEGLVGPDNESDNDDVQRRRARIHQELGWQLCESASERVRAIGYCQVALTILDRLQKNNVDGPAEQRLRAETLFDRAVAEADLDTHGIVQQREQNQKEARRDYDAAELLLRKLIASADPILRKQIASVGGDGDTSKVARTPEAEAEFERKKADFDKDRRNLARTLGYRGDLDLKMKKVGEADAAYWESHAIREALAKEKPRDNERKFQLARSWQNFAGYQTQQRVLGTSLFFHSQAETHRKELIARQPDNKMYLVDYARSLNRIAELELFDTLNKANLSSQEQLARFDAIEKRLKCGRDLVKGMYGDLEQDPRHDDQTAEQADTLLGECNAVRARVALLRRRLLQEDPAATELARTKARDEAKAAARESRDSYLRIEEREKLDTSRKSAEPAKGGKKKRLLTADQLYHQAAASYIHSETLEQSDADTGRTTDPSDRAKRLLETAFKKGFQRLATEDVAHDPAFKSVAHEDWFKKLLEPKGDKPETLSTATKTTTGGN